MTTYHNETCIYIARGIWYENALDMIAQGDPTVFDKVNNGESVAEWIVTNADQSLTSTEIVCRCDMHRAFSNQNAVKYVSHAFSPARATAMKWYSLGAMFSLTQHYPDVTGRI